MASLTITNTFTGGTTILSAAMNTNFDDVENYINNRNSGSATWDRLLVTSSSAVPLIANNSSGTSDIVNFNDNGTTVFKVTDAGNIVIGSAALATDATNGFFYLESCAGTPTGVATTYTGRVASVYDSTNNRFYIYDGGWVDIGNPAVDNITLAYSTNILSVKDGGISALKLANDLDIPGLVKSSTTACFLAYNSVTDSDATGDGTTVTVVFDTEVFDQASNYNNGTGIFTAPATGRYLFCINVQFGDLFASSAEDFRIDLITTARTFRNLLPTGTASGSVNSALTLSMICNMTSGDTARVDANASGGAKTVDIVGSSAGFTSFSGMLIA